MADRYTGIEQEFVLETTGGSDLTTLLGNQASINYEINHDNEPRSSAGHQPTLQEAVDGMTEISVSIDCEPPTLKAAQVVGDYSEDTGAGTWTVDLTDQLPELRAKIQATSDKVLVVEGLKFDGFTLTIRSGEVVEMTVPDGNNGNATYVELQDTTITTPDLEGKPDSYLDNTVSLDSETVGSIETATIEYRRNIQARRSIQEYTSGERRLPDEITEGNKRFTWDTTIEISDDQAFRVHFNDDSYPLTLADFSESVPVEITLDQADSTSGSIELQGGRPSDLGGELLNDDDIRTVDMSGNGLTSTITGDL